MLAAGLVLFGLVSPAACQFNDTSSFHLDGLTSGLLAIYCIFTLLFLLLAGWGLVALILARGHRSPYALLFLAIIFAFIANVDNIAYIVVDNFPSDYNFPAHLLPDLDAVFLLFYNWSTLLLFFALVAVLWNRESAIRVATEGKAGKQNPALIVVHAVLAVLMLVLGTAGPAVFVDALGKYETSSRSASAFDDYLKRFEVYHKMNYAFSTFVVLTGVDIAASTFLLWSACRAARITDKITNTMFYVVVPLYGLLNLFVMIFTIVFSDKGLPATASATAWESANLADNLLVLLFSFAVIVALLFMSASRTNWEVHGDTIQSAQQPYINPGHYQGQPTGQPVYYYNNPQPYMPSPPGQTPYQQALYQPPFPFQQPIPVHQPLMSQEPVAVAAPIS